MAEDRRNEGQHRDREERGSRSERSGGEKLDVNRASAEELDQIFGVGPSNAEKIIRYRDQELGGSFHSEHDITHIPGIGEDLARKIAREARFD